MKYLFKLKFYLQISLVLRKNMPEKELSRRKMYYDDSDNDGNSSGEKVVSPSISKCSKQIEDLFIELESSSKSINW